MSEPVRKIQKYEDWHIQPKWFKAEKPANAVKASAVLAFSDPVADGDKVTIGDEVYEFDIDETVATGSIPVDVYELLNQATNTLTFTGTITNAETVTISDGTTPEVYEFVDAQEPYQGDNIPVKNDADAIDNLVTAINGGDLVTAVKDSVEDAVIITAVVRGTAGNAYTVVTDCVNAKFAGEGKSETLADGLDTVVEEDAAEALVDVINDTSTIVSATQDDDEVLVEYLLAGEEGNISITASGGHFAWEDGATKLAGGQFGTPCPMRGIVVVTVDEDGGEDYYVCMNAGGKNNVRWKTFTLEDIPAEDDD